MYNMLKYVVAPYPTPQNCNVPIKKIVSLSTIPSQEQVLASMPKRLYSTGLPSFGKFTAL